MNTITNASTPLKLFAAFLTLALIAATALTVTMTAGDAQAQTSDNNYADPVPCGPGAGTASQPEPHEKTSGHFALFDAYWQWTSHNPNEGIMHTNDCPPLMVTTREDDGFGNVTTTTARNASGIDIEEVIMHVLDKHQATVVATNAEVTEDGGQLSLEEYPAVRRALGLGENDPVPAGTKVWWLRLDAPDTTADETSDLGMGFSAALFDDKYWYRPDGKAMRYMFEAERYPGSDPADVPHFYAYEAPDIRAVDPDTTGVKLVWDSTKVHYPGQAMEMDPGEYRPLQWIFTKEGTYEVSVNFEGFVRLDNPHQPGHDEYDENWKRISGNDTETTGERTYTIQVGKLAETEPPMFGVNRRAHEEASAGTHVGEPILVFNAEVPALSYALSGDGHDNFSVTSRTNPNAAQIVVASGASLDFDTQSSYDLILEVSDGKDHEGNDDSSVDHSIGVKIELIEEKHPFTRIFASNHTPATGESVTLQVGTWSLPDGVAYDDITYIIWEKTETGQYVSGMGVSRESDSPLGTLTVSHADAGTYKYSSQATYTLNGVDYRIESDPVTVTWRNSSQ